MLTYETTVSHADLEQYLETFAWLLEQGYDLPRTLELITLECPESLIETHRQVAEHINAGIFIYLAMNRFPEVFPTFVSGFMRLGQKGGNLSVMIRQCLNLMTVMNFHHGQWCKNFFTEPYRKAILLSVFLKSFGALLELGATEHQALNEMHFITDEFAFGRNLEDEICTLNVSFFEILPGLSSFFPEFACEFLKPNNLKISPGKACIALGNYYFQKAPGLIVRRHKAYT